jgi:hypothetical protein|tara:strand:- start:848 stop:1045 length:198 start_codon:yes stop_codon:yes gene_type:complete
MMREENLTNKEIVEILLARQEFLLTEMYAADRLDGWNLKGITDELKELRIKLQDLSGSIDREENS